MNKTITDSELKKLEKFIGYGRPDADIIFFGLEEAGGGFENLKNRLSIEDYEYLDCKRFHLDHLVHKKKYKLHSDDEDKMVNFQSVWRYMSYIMLKLEGKSKEEIFKNNSKILRKYQNNLLGTKAEEGNTLLTEIYPIPCSSLKLWGTKEINYKEVIPQYLDKNDYKTKVLPNRIKDFQDLINSDQFQARSIICYGKSKWPEFKSFFKEFDVEFENLKLSKPSKKGRLSNGTAVYLLPFFGNGQVSYEFLDEVINDIRS